MLNTRNVFSLNILFAQKEIRHYVNKSFQNVQESFYKLSQYSRNPYIQLRDNQPRQSRIFSSEINSPLSNYLVLAVACHLDLDWADNVISCYLWRYLCT